MIQKEVEANTSTESSSRGLNK